MRPGIDITDSYFGQPTPVETSVSFSLSYPAWVRLSHSKLWHDVEMEIDALQKNPMPRTILELLNERYPDHDMLRIKECGAVLGVSKYETVMNRLGKAGVPIVDATVNKVFLARYMCGSLHR